MTDGAKRGRGRPRKAPEKGERRNYTFRLHEHIREELLQAAKASKRTLSEEIEWRVEHSFIELLAIHSLSQELKYWMREAGVPDDKIQAAVSSLSLGAPEAIQAVPELLSGITKSANVNGSLTPERNETLTPASPQPAPPLDEEAVYRAVLRALRDARSQDLTAEDKPEP